MNVINVPTVFFSDEDVEMLEEFSASIFQVCEPKKCAQCPFYGLITTTCDEFRLTLDNIITAAKRNNNAIHGWSDD